MEQGAPGAAELRALQEASRARVEQAQRRATAAREQLRRERTTSTSSSRAVAVTVDAAGTLLDLTLGAGAAKLPPPALAQEILRTYRDATRKAVTRTQEIVRDLVGADSPVLAAIRAAAGANDAENDSEEP
jgi:DNA-binding protein YbaB